MRNATNRYFSADVLACGFDDVHETLYVQHCEGLISAREYQHRLKILRAHFGVKAPDVPAGDHCKVIRLSRMELTVLEGKISTIRGLVDAEVRETVENHSSTDRKTKVGVSVGKLSVGIMQYCSKDGEVNPYSSQVDAAFDIVVKYTKRRTVRV